MSRMSHWLRGDMSLATTASDPLRARSSQLGDILNSQPGITTKASFGYTTCPRQWAGVIPVRALWRARDVKEVRDPVIFVGANDGMLHASVPQRPGVMNCLRSSPIRFCTT